MNKKGMELWTTLAVIIVIIVTVIFLIAIGPKKLREDVLGGIDDFVNYFIPGGNIPEFSGESQVPDEISSFYNNLVNAIKNAPDDDNCLIPIGNFPENFRNYKITLNSQETKIEKVDEGTFIPFEPKQIPDFKPCIVTGQEAINFYDCHVLYKKDSCDDIFMSADSLEINDDNYLKYLFKSGPNFCIIESYDDIDFLTKDCDSPRAGGEEGIDDDCLGFIEGIEICR